jgi:spore coat protein A
MPEKIKLQKFVDELPIINTISPKWQSNNRSYYEVTMKEFSQKLHRDLGPTRLWGYDGTFPGPTFEVMKNETVFVLNGLIIYPKNTFFPLIKQFMVPK